MDSKNGVTVLEHSFKIMGGAKQGRGMWKPKTLFEHQYPNRIVKIPFFQQIGRV